jgi:hypothetical protein
VLEECFGTNWHVLECKVCIQACELDEHFICSLSLMPIPSDFDLFLSSWFVFGSCLYFVWATAMERNNAGCSISRQTRIFVTSWTMNSFYLLHFLLTPGRDFFCATRTFSDGTTLILQRALYFPGSTAVSTPQGDPFRKRKQCQKWKDSPLKAN